ncbi:MAG TPA: helix-turn-helix transcriptional regulator [Ktedonobacteraceae bacterium]
MKQSETPLKVARLQKQWTPEFVSHQIGVSLRTYHRWEAGAQIPRSTSLQALCQMFHMSPEELGFRKTDIQQQVGKQKDERPKVPAHTQKQTTPDFSEEMNLMTIGINSCWQIYMAGNQVELERLLPTYLANLRGPALMACPEQKVAARLIALTYQLLALLELQRNDFVAAHANATQALVYSQLGRDWNIYVASQIHLATIFNATKRVGSALAAYNDALRRINLSMHTISPLLQSHVFAALGEIQAAMGREKEALQFLQLAMTVFPDKPEEDPSASYVQSDRSLLFLYEGLIFLRLGLPRRAWEAFAHVDSMQPTPPERVRAEFLKQKAYTSIMLGNTIQSCVYLEAVARSAQTLHSELMWREVYALYEHMLALWGQEARVRSLARLFQEKSDH